MAETVCRNRPSIARLAGEIGRRRLSDAVQEFLSHRDLDSLLNSNVGLFPRFMDKLSATLGQAFGDGCETSLFESHKSLYYLYEDNIGTPRPGRSLNQYHPFIIRIRNEIERAWEESERRRIDLDPGEVPADGPGFARLLKERCFSHKLADHALFDFLETEARHDEMVSFFLHEGTLILRFCDLIVLAMVGADEEVRSELAENFWDEVGNGNYQNRHTELYRRLLAGAGLEFQGGHFLSEQLIDKLGWQGLAGYNLYLNFALHRRNYYRSMGAMGVAEMMDPPQYERIVRGCRRVGFDDEGSLAYYVGHAEMDIAHGDGWLTNVMIPLIRRHPEAGYDMVLGALMRINTTTDYYDALHAKLTGGRARPSLFEPDAEANALYTAGV